MTAPGDRIKHPAPSGYALEIKTSRCGNFTGPFHEVVRHMMKCPACPTRETR